MNYGNCGTRQPPVVGGTRAEEMMLLWYDLIGLSLFPWKWMTHPGSPRLVWYRRVSCSLFGSHQTGGGRHGQCVLAAWTEKEWKLGVVTVQ